MDDAVDGVVDDAVDDVVDDVAVGVVDSVVVDCFVVGDSEPRHLNANFGKIKINSEATKMHFVTNKL